MLIFQSIPGMNGLSKSIALVQKQKKCGFIKVSIHFQKKEVKKSKFKTFTGSSLTLSTRRVARSDNGGVRGRSPLPCTHVDKACKKTPCFKENWMNFLKMLVLTLTLRQLWRYIRLKLMLRFMFYLNANFSKSSRVEWVK